jgi:hypothetical protein
MAALHNRAADTETINHHFHRNLSGSSRYVTNVNDAYNQSARHHKLVADTIHAFRSSLYRKNIGARS